jgi:hypothetical protein
VFPVRYELNLYILRKKKFSVRSIGQGEARYRKYKRLNFDGGQAYDRSSD